MSAPLVVNTTDGTVWTRREGTRGGEALYAPEKCGVCPKFVMATLTELAVHGIAGSADVLPVPVGPEPRALSETRLAEIRNRRYDEVTPSPWLVADGEDGKPVVYVELPAGGVRVLFSGAVSEADAQFVASARQSVPELVTEVERLQQRIEAMEAARAVKDKALHDAAEHVAALLAERHVTNEALDDAAKALRVQRDRIAEMEALADAATEFRVWEPGYGLYIRRAPGASGFAILEARRTSQGRRAWTTAGLRYTVALSDEELFCWPDAESAVAEARRVLPGAQVREDGPDGITQLMAPSQALRDVPDGEHYAAVHHGYTKGRDLPETGGAK